MLHVHESQAEDALSTVDVSTLRRYIAETDLPSLLVTLAFLTGDRSLISEEYRSTAPLMGAKPEDGLAAEVREKAQEHALAALLRYRSSPRDLETLPDDDALMELLQFTTGPVSSAYVPILIHELGLGPRPGAPLWHKDEVAPQREFTVAIIGAGMCGLLAAYRLAQAGVDHVVFERSTDVGGVWFANDYPGARLDTSNLTYSYSFEPHDWQDQYSRRDDVMEYFRSVAVNRGIVDKIRFGTTVLEGEFDVERGGWLLRFESSDGVVTRQYFDAVISAVGQLSEPNFPDITGRDTFRGPAWHTARWDHSVELRGKRLAIIGTGASAFQVIPQVASQADNVVIFQRTPAWVLPTPGYTSPVPEGQLWFLRNLPHFTRWQRFHQFWLQVEGIRDLAVVDPNWDHPVSVSEKNEEVRASLERSMRATFSTRPDLADKLVPDYPPFAKRSVRDDGTWSSALMRENVEVTTDSIAEITASGVRTADGTVHEVDAIVYGTGFTASDFLSSFSLRGPYGKLLSEFWNGDARAYYGISVPGFPNLFVLYGPNTNLNVNGSAVLFAEAAVDHIVACIESLLVSGKQSMTVRDDLFRDFNDRIDEASLTLAVGVSTVNSWYKNSSGRVSQNWPLSTLEYWGGTHADVMPQYEYLDAGATD